MTERSVVELMDEIRAEVRTRYERGDYPAEIAAELEETIGELSPAERYARRLEALRSTRFSAEIEAASRKRVVGPVVAGAKRTVRDAMRWHTNALLGQMGTFGDRVVGALEVLGDRVSDVENRGGDLRTEFDETRRDLIAELATLRERADAFQEFVDNVGYAYGDRISRLERAVREARVAAPSGEQAAAVDPSFEVERRFDYIGFEDAFRGDSAHVAEKQRPYVEHFRGAPGRVLDVGCGRGEFLALLKGERIDAYGVDRHEDMVLECREKGLEIVQADAVEHLATLEKGALGGIFAAQVVEHFEGPDVVRFFELGAEVLAPNGVLIVETVNPQSLYVFAHALYLDLGHDRPLHPRTLRFLAERAGFRDVRIEYLSLPGEDERPMPLPETADDALREVLERIEENFRRIDSVVFGPQDYAVIARR